MNSYTSNCELDPALSKKQTQFGVNAEDRHTSEVSVSISLSIVPRIIPQTLIF